MATQYWITLHEISISYVPIMYESRLTSMQLPDKNIAYKESTWSNINIRVIEGIIFVCENILINFSFYCSMS